MYSLRIRVQTWKNILSPYICFILHSSLNEIYAKTLKQNPRARKNLKEYKASIIHVRKLRTWGKEHHSDCFVNGYEKYLQKKVSATKISGIYPKLKADVNQITFLSYVHKTDHHKLDAYDPSENFLSFCNSFWHRSKTENLDEAHTHVTVFDQFHCSNPNSCAHNNLEIHSSSE